VQSKREKSQIVRQFVQANLKESNMLIYAYRDLKTGAWVRATVEDGRQLE